MTFFEVIFYAFIAVVVIQILYYFILFSRFAFGKSQEPKPKNIPVSVIICAKNEAKNLKSFLPSILQQDYPNFEVVLINDMSNDNTLEIMEDFAEMHKNIKVVDVKTHDAFWGNKKYALTLGIKAATNNFLLFTDADCKADSSNWIREMSSHFSSEKTIILGYGAHTKVPNSILNKLIRFETVLTAIQYFSYAKAGMPYMATGRNLAYTKEQFFQANGFMSHMNLRSGDDDLFVNQVATKKNTAICTQENGFTTSLAKKSFKNWYRQKRRHITTASNYKAIHKFLLAAFYSSQILFLSLGAFLILVNFNWQIVTGIIVFRYVMLYLVFGFSARKLKETDLIFFIPFLELFLVIMQLAIFSHNLISKPNYWK